MQDLDYTIRHLYVVGVGNPTSVAASLNINAKYARELLALGRYNGLVELVDVDGEDAWRLTEAGRRHAASALDTRSPRMVDFDLKAGRPANHRPKEPAMTETTATETKPARTRKAVEPHPCACGCDRILTTKSTFAQGHDARMVSQLVSAIVGANTKTAALIPPALRDREEDLRGGNDIQWRIDEATKEVKQAFGVKLADKAYSALMNGWTNYDRKQTAAAEKAAKKGTKAQPTVEDAGTVKVGRWDYPAREIDGVLHRNAKRDGSSQEWVAV